MGPSAKAPNMGQVIEYLADRLYLASYLNPPDEDTLFPYGSSASGKSPSKRSRAGREPYYFTVDDSLLYNAFHHDFGPLHIGHLYHFALFFHEILAATENQQRPVVFWSKADPRSRANASCLLACYMVLIQSWPPHLALAPVAQVDPPLMPFRDAGYSQADYGITVQDIVYGVWKAKEEGLCLLESFDLTEYEHFERVENGDFNWITPQFLAFASPQHEPVERITEAVSPELYAALPRTLEAVDAHPTLPQPFKNVLRHFSERNIGLVVRLNSPLYSPSYFEALGIQHLDMIFDDGTCPTLSTVRRFVRLAHEVITVRKKAIAVHCKAGLGRTGCLIGAYLIYRHGFTANEIISFMRFMRPGMVVGPQQHWLHLNQGTFREWWVEERYERKMRREVAAAVAAATAKALGGAANGGVTSSSSVPKTPIRAMQKASLGRASQSSPQGAGAGSATTATPPHYRSVSGRSPLSEMDQERTNAAAQEDHLPPPTPGQPRKTARAERHHPYARSKSGYAAAMAAAAVVVEEKEEETTTERRSGSSGSGGNGDEVELFAVVDEAGRLSNSSRGTDSEEELYLRMRMRHKTSATTSTDGMGSSSSSSGSQRHRHKTRSASHSHNSHHGSETSTATTVTSAMSATSTTSTMTTMTTVVSDSNDASFDAENIGSSLSRVKSMREVGGRDQRVVSASGVLTKVRASADRGDRQRAGVHASGVRKASGRVGSAGQMPSAAVLASAARKVSGMQ